MSTGRLPWGHARRPESRRGRSHRGPVAGGATRREALADAHRGGSLVSAGSTHLWHGFSELRRGDLAAAEESALGGRERAAAVGPRRRRVDPQPLLPGRGPARARSARRTPTACSSRWGRSTRGHNTTGWWLEARVALLTAAGRAEEALEVADELAAHSEEVPGPARLWWRSLKAEALDRLERREEAIELAQAELEVTRAFGAPSALGRTLRVLGTLERDDGLDRLREAVAVVEGSTARLEHAKALAALGAALRRARQPSEAREPLRRALELAGVCGADGLAAQVRAGAARRRRPSPPRRPQRRRLADAERAPRRRPRRGRAQQPRDRAGALRDAEDGRGPPLERLSQARHPLAARARARPWGRGAPLGDRVPQSSGRCIGIASMSDWPAPIDAPTHIDRKGPDPWPSAVTRPAPRPRRPPRRRRLGCGARHLQRPDRPATGGDRVPVERTGGRGRRRGRPRARPARRRPGDGAQPRAARIARGHPDPQHLGPDRRLHRRPRARVVRAGAATRWEAVTPRPVRARAGRAPRLLAGRGHRRLLARRRHRLARPQARHAGERRDRDRARHRRGPPRPHRRRARARSVLGPARRQRQLRRRDRHRVRGAAGARALRRRAVLPGRADRPTCWARGTGSCRRSPRSSRRGPPSSTSRRCRRCRSPSADAAS